jgi:hypothetical protein
MNILDEVPHFKSTLDEPVLFFEEIIKTNRITELKLEIVMLHEKGHVFKNKDNYLLVSIGGVRNIIPGMGVYK